MSTHTVRSYSNEIAFFIDISLYRTIVKQSNILGSIIFSPPQKQERKNEECCGRLSEVNGYFRYGKLENLDDTRVAEERVKW